MQPACWTTAVVVLTTLLGGPIGAGDDGGIDYQRTADRTPLDWDEPAKRQFDQMASPLYAMGQFPVEYEVRLVRKQGQARDLIYEVREGERTCYAWPGHGRTVFAALAHTLYYAEFHPSGSGGNVVAVDLTTGKVIWRKPLKALGPVEHSAYRNHVTLSVNTDVVTVTGEESFGRYVEFKGLKTGETLGHKMRLTR